MNDSKVDFLYIVMTLAHLGIVGLLVFSRQAVEGVSALELPRLHLILKCQKITWQPGGSAWKSHLFPLLNRYLFQNPALGLAICPSQQ